MPPKKDNKEIKEESLTAVIVVDSFDRRFSPLTQSVGSWCLQPICNSPIIHYTLSWVARTECKNVILVVTEKNADNLQEVEQEWKSFFVNFSVIVSSNAMSVGDSLRELEGRGLLTGDFLLISNPATITSATLHDQVKKFRELRRTDKNNVMTLIYSPLENVNGEVVAIAKNSNRLRLYHRADDASQLDVDKPNFVEDVVIRRDISDTGIAICSVNIAAQFSDNFDFQHRDDVIREILVNEEILLQQIHVEVLSDHEAAICVTDYESLLLANNLLMERWFYPIVPDRMPAIGDWSSVATDWNIYATVNVEQKGSLSAQNLSCLEGFNVCVGGECDIDEEARVNNTSIGNNVTIGKDTEVMDCIIGDGCVISHGCRIVGAVLSSGVTVPAGSHIQSKAIIAANVLLPKNFEIPADCAISATAPDEDDDELLQLEQSNGLCLWRFIDGQPFWKYDFRARKKPVVVGGALPNSDDDASGSESEDDVNGGEMDPCAVFLEEVIDSMERIRSLEFSQEKINNLILEINSSKLANNISMDDVAKNVFFAFLGLKGNDDMKGFKELAKKWEALFRNYYRPKKSQIQLLLGLEEKHKESPEAFTPNKVAVIVHWLFDDFEILEEEGILEWAKSLPDSPLKTGMQKIVDWLEADSDEDSEEDSD